MDNDEALEVALRAAKKYKAVKELLTAARFERGLALRDAIAAGVSKNVLRTVVLESRSSNAVNAELAWIALRGSTEQATHMVEVALPDDSVTGEGYLRDHLFRAGDLEVLGPDEWFVPYDFNLEALAGRDGSVAAWAARQPIIKGRLGRYFGESNSWSGGLLLQGDGNVQEFEQAIHDKVAEIAPDTWEFMFHVAFRGANSKMAAFVPGETPREDSYDASVSLATAFPEFWARVIELRVAAEGASVSNTEQLSSSASEFMDLLAGENMEER